MKQSNKNTQKQKTQRTYFSEKDTFRKKIDTTMRFRLPFTPGWIFRFRTVHHELAKNPSCHFDLTFRLSSPSAKSIFETNSGCNKGKLQLTGRSWRTGWSFKRLEKTVSRLGSPTRLAPCNPRTNHHSSVSVLELPNLFQKPAVVLFFVFCTKKKHKKPPNHSQLQKVSVVEVSTKEILYKKTP